MNTINVLRVETAEQIIDDLAAGFIDGEQAGPALHRLGFSQSEIWETVQTVTERRALAALGDER